MALKSAGSVFHNLTFYCKVCFLTARSPDPPVSLELQRTVCNKFQYESGADLPFGYWASPRDRPGGASVTDRLFQKQPVEPNHLHDNDSLSDCALCLS